mgnify:CR=1 FL=1
MAAYPPSLAAFIHTHSPVEGAYLSGFGLLMATGFLWLARRGPTAVARAAGVVRGGNDDLEKQNLLLLQTVTF